MVEVRFDRQRSRLEIDGWSTRVRPLARLSQDDPSVDRVSLHIRRGVNVVKGVSEGSEQVLLETWAGEPELSDGLAVVTDPEGDPIGIARIPLCSCGERGCGNAGVQLYYDIPVATIPP